MTPAIIGFLVVCGIAGAAVRSSKNEAGAGFICGLLLGPLGVVVAAAWPASEKAQSKTQKRCPDCAELVKVEAAVCKHCGYRAESPDAWQPLGPVGSEGGAGLSRAELAGMWLLIGLIVIGLLVLLVHVSG